MLTRVVLRLASDVDTCRVVIGLLVGGKLFWVLDDVASSLEVLFLHPGVVSLTDEDAQGKNKAKGKDRGKA
ncbi:hypothetical protein FF2_014890 [Malus domestica]